MKKVFLALAIAAACYACGSNNSTEATTPISNNDSNGNSQIGSESTNPANTNPQTPATGSDTTRAGDVTTTVVAGGKDGKALIEASDCRTCHLDKDKLIGPAYIEVSKKYPNTDANVKQLAGKIIAGGTGVWGQIPMLAHPNVSEEDAQAMVKYIFTIK